jgi:glycosyltransferase involved in cell wall biosynthesis
MSTTPVVTVIIPSYNCEAYIDQTLDSVLAQDLHDIEVLVVDDGSTDRTRELVSRRGGNVRLLPQANQGVCAARNRGIREARGEFICLMDHDDYWYPHKLSSQVELMRSHAEVSVVYSAFLLWHRASDGQFPDPASFDLGADGIDPDYSGWIYHQLLIDCWMLTSTAMFRREVFERCGVFDESLPYSEDWDLWLRIAQCYPFIMQTRATTLYRQHPQQGNRKVRDIDYRTRLLQTAVRRWGYCSRDGRCTPREVFRRQLAGFHLSYGFGHLRAGNRLQGVRAFARAWRNWPGNPRYLAYIAAAMAGWKPKW